VSNRYLLIGKKFRNDFYFFIFCGVIKKNSTAGKNDTKIDNTKET